MRKASILFLLAILVALFAGCDPAELEDSGSMWSKVSSDDKEALTAIGDVYGIYEKEESRFVNGQSVSTNFRDLEGNYLDLVFHGYLVAYNEINSQLLSYVNTLEYANAQRHQHYAGVEWRDDVTYVEYYTYRFKDSGRICFVGIRVFNGDFKNTYNNNEYYAKSIRFDPSLRYDLTRHVVVATGESIQVYDPLTQTATIRDTFASDLITPAMQAIASSMAITLDADMMGRLYKHTVDENTFYVTGWGICDKTAVENLPTKFSTGEINAQFVRFNADVYDGFDKDYQYLFNIACYLNQNDELIRYSVRLLDGDAYEANPNDYYARSKSYDTVDQITDAFNPVV